MPGASHKCPSSRGLAGLGAPPSVARAGKGTGAVPGCREPARREFSREVDGPLSGSYGATMETVLIAVDGSSGANDAIELLLHLPLEKQTRVCAVHVVEQEEPFFGSPDIDDADREVSDAIAAELEVEAKGIVADAAGRLGAKGWSVETTIRIGPPADELIAAAESFDADLIVLGATGRRESSGLGRTARRVLQETARAVALARKLEAEKPSLDLLFAFDGSDASRPGIDVVRRLATSGSHVTVLSVLTVATTLYRYDIVERMSATWQAYRAKVLATAEGVAASLRDTGARVETEILDGGTDADDEVLAAAQRIEPDLTIVGRSGKGAIRKLFLGSVAESLCESAPGSVWILPRIDPETEQDE